MRIENKRINCVDLWTIAMKYERKREKFKIEMVWLWYLMVHIFKAGNNYRCNFFLLIFQLKLNAQWPMCMDIASLVCQQK